MCENLHVFIEIAMNPGVEERQFGGVFRAASKKFYRRLVDNLSWTSHVIEQSPKEFGVRR